MATKKKTSLKPSTRAKGQLRVDQQAAAKKLAKTKRTVGGQMTAKEGQALQRKAAAPANKKKRGNSAVGLAHRLRSRFPK